MPRRSSRQRHAFTLIELLVVISIIGLLIAILLPSLRNATEAASQSNCQSNIRQLAQAQFAYVADHQRHAPLWITGTGIANNDFLNYISANASDSTEPETVLNCTKVGRAEIEQFNTDPAIGVASYGLNPGIVGPEWDYNPDKVPNPAQYILIAEQPVEQSDLAITSDGMTRPVSTTGTVRTYWNYFTNHKPERGYRHNNEGGNAAMNDGHVEFLNPTELTLSGNGISPLSNMTSEQLQDSRWLWWAHADAGIIAQGSCSCGN